MRKLQMLLLPEATGNPPGDTGAEMKAGDMRAPPCPSQRWEGIEQREIAWGFFLIREPRCMLSRSVESTLCNPMDCSHQAPLSMGFFRQEYWSGLQFPPGDLPNPGIESVSPASTGEFFTTDSAGKPREPIDDDQILGKKEPN